MASLLERYADQIRGVVSCYDRVIIQGTLPGFCYAQGMTSYLYEQKIRIFDYVQWAEPLKERIRANAEEIAAENGLAIEHLKKMKELRKEERVKQVLKDRGDHPGWVHIFSAMESCDSYKPWHDKMTGKTFLKPDSGRCLHYYFYFIDPEFGLCFLRIPTWAPFRVTFYFNGHNWLASQLGKKEIGYRRMENAFLDIDDFSQAQKLSDQFKVSQLHQSMDRWVSLCCPILKDLNVTYHWSLSQVEYATDIVFKKQEDLKEIYGVLTRTAIHAVKPEDVATFLGRKLHGHYQDEVGNNFSTRIAGTRIRHQMGPASLKMYDKFGLILRLETTTYDVTFFKHHRMVEQKDGPPVFKLAALKKSIYSLNPDLRQLLYDSNKRYLAFLSDIDDPTVGIQSLRKISEPVRDNDRNYRGYNLFQQQDQTLFENILRGEYAISGLRNKDLQKTLGKTVHQISAALKRLRLHGLIRKVGKTYKYYLTDFGRSVALLGLKLKELYVIPELARVAAR